MNAPAAGELEQYRSKARVWLDANLQRRTTRTGGPTNFGSGDFEAAGISAQRVLQRRLHEAGYAGITWPTEYGGQGLHPAFERAFNDEARAYVLPDLGLVGGATLAVCGPTMLAHASPEFLHQHIPRILSGDEIVAQFFSDPEAGSDLAAVRTHAVRRGDSWILNGSKIWSSGAYYADIGMCLARTDWDVPKHRGLTWFAVPTDAPGVTVSRIRQINGNSEFCQEYFTDVQLTDADVIGEVNNGWAVTQTMLLYERGSGVMRSPGSSSESGIPRDIARLAVDADVAGDPVKRDLLAAMVVDDLARRALNRRLLARMAAQPQLAANLASYAKLASGVLDPERANRAMRIAGQTALTWETETEGAATALAFLNSRFLAIAGGTNEMQRNSIGERVLGLPREPSFDSRTPFRDVVRNSQNWSGQVG